MCPEAAAAAAFVRAAGAAGLGASRLWSGAGRFYVTCLLPRVGSVPRPAAGQPGGSGPGHLRAARPWGRLPAPGGNAPRPADPSTRAGAAHLAPSGLRAEERGGGGEAGVR